MTNHLRTKPSLRRALLTTMAIIVAVLALGCTHADPEPITSAPSASATPSLSPEELNTEAERVYRLYFAEVVKLESAGGADELPPIMSDILTGVAYTQLEAIMREAKLKGIHFGPGEVTHLLAIAVASGEGVEPDAVIATRSCNDATGMTVYDGQGHIVGYGSIVERISSYKWDSGVLKIFRNRTREVEACQVP